MSAQKVVFILLLAVAPSCFASPVENALRVTTSENDSGCTIQGVQALKNTSRFDLKDITSVVRIATRTWTNSVALIRPGETITWPLSGNQTCEILLRGLTPVVTDIASTDQQAGERRDIFVSEVRYGRFSEEENFRLSTVPVQATAELHQKARRTYLKVEGKNLGKEPLIVHVTDLSQDAPKESDLKLEPLSGAQIEYEVQLPQADFLFPVILSWKELELDSFLVLYPTSAQESQNKDDITVTQLVVAILLASVLYLLLRNAAIANGPIED